MWIKKISTSKSECVGFWIYFQYIWHIHLSRNCLDNFFLQIGCTFVFTLFWVFYDFFRVWPALFSSNQSDWIIRIYFPHILPHNVCKHSLSNLLFFILFDAHLSPHSMCTCLPLWCLLSTSGTYNMINKFFSLSHFRHDRQHWLWWKNSETVENGCLFTHRWCFPPTSGHTIT